MCEVCENTTLFVKGLNNACKSKDIPADPHAIVEHCSCNSKIKECMMSSCVECKYHCLSIDDFRDEEENELSESDSDSEARVMWSSITSGREVRTDTLQK